MREKMFSGSFKNDIYKMYLEIIYLIYMYKQDLGLNNLQWLICHKTQPNQIIYIQYIYIPTPPTRAGVTQGQFLSGV